MPRLRHLHHLLPSPSLHLIIVHLTPEQPPIHHVTLVLSSPLLLFSTTTTTYTDSTTTPTSITNYFPAVTSLVKPENKRDCINLTALQNTSRAVHLESTRRRRGRDSASSTGLPLALPPQRSRELVINESMETATEQKRASGSLSPVKESSGTKDLRVSRYGFNFF